MLKDTEPPNQEPRKWNKQDTTTAIGLGIIFILFISGCVLLAKVLGL